MGLFVNDEWCRLLQSSNNDEEVVSESATLQIYLIGTAPRKGLEDTFKWFKSTTGSYSVSSGYELFSASSSNISYEAESLATFKIIWKSFVPSKIQVLGWRCVIDRLATREQLAKRGILTDSRDKVCVFYFMENETLAHLLLSCPLSRIVWSIIFSWLGVVPVLDVGVMDHMLAFCRSLNGKIPPRKIMIFWFQFYR
ncbi:uncharacterized protein LOC131614631 [Vicia villosa]|uniref:uncharacterized protein LOC131614631 n=1 Tax=Vicia villosa TaxID=3911 RepID=UPI00273C3D10|nr:uncharacterized protein LOC131614631 [Vicia villosa]